MTWLLIPVPSVAPAAHAFLPIEKISSIRKKTIPVGCWLSGHWSLFFLIKVYVKLILSRLCTTQLLAEYSVDSQRPSLVVLLWTLRDRGGGFSFCILIAITTRISLRSKFF